MSRVARRTSQLRLAVRLHAIALVRSDGRGAQPYLPCRRSRESTPYQAKEIEREKYLVKGKTFLMVCHKVNADFSIVPNLPSRVMRLNPREEAELFISFDF